MTSRPRISHAFIEQHQRQRLLRAAALLAARDGAAGLTAGRLMEDARMARKTFYGLFPTNGAFLEFAFEQAFAHVFDPVLAATDAEGPWLDRLDGALEGLFNVVSDDPAFAALCLVHSQQSPAANGCDYQAGVNAVADMLAGGREAGRRARGRRYRDPPPNVEEFLGRAIVSIAAMRLRQGRAAGLRDQWMEMAVLASTPFFGPGVGSRFAAALDPAPAERLG
jgi:AcrR family transcriptional regulator